MSKGMPNMADIFMAIEGVDFPVSREDVLEKFETAKKSKLFRNDPEEIESAERLVEEFEEGFIFRNPSYMAKKLSAKASEIRLGGEEEEEEDEEEEVEEIKPKKTNKKIRRK